MAAEYGIDLLLTIKNSNKLKQLNKDFKQTNEEQKRVRQGLKEMDKGYKKFFPSLNNVVRSLSKAQEMFNKTALGTKANTMAAKDLVAAQRLLNHELAQRNRLLKAIRGGGFESNIVQNVGRSQRGRAGSGFAAFSNRASEVAESAKTEAIKEKARERHLKNIGKNVAKIATIQTQQQAQAAFSALPGGTFGIAGGQIGPRLPIQNRLGFGKNALGGPFAMPGGAMGRLKGGAGSALIGGGFPLLFGAGGLSSVMGGIAGGLGGALAPGGGFAASIAATAAAAQIEKTIAFRKELNKVNLELESMGIASTFSRKQIKELAKEFKITNDEAIKLATTFKTFGSGQADMLLSAFGSREVFDTLSGLRTTEAVLGKIEGLREQISETTRQDLLQTLATKGSLETQAKLERVIFEQRKKAFVEKEIDKLNILDIPKEFRQTKALQKEFANMKRIEFGSEFENANGAALQLLETQVKINEQMQFLSEFNAPAEEIRELLNPMRAVLDLSTSIRTGFEESFKGIIKGTMSVQDAFRNMLGRIADHFLDTAARLAAAQLQKGFLSLFSNLFSFNSFTRDPISATPTLTPEQQVSRFSFMKADGGPVKGGNSYIVGERGPEMFSPGVSGMITPNHALGGSTNIVVNVDASGSSVEGDEEQGRELGRMISVAIQSELIKQKRPGGMLA